MKRRFNWFDCKGTIQPKIRKCTGCPMFTVRNNNPICLYENESEKVEDNL